MLRLFRMNKEYGGRWVTGVPPGLQNQCGALRASRVGSIPTCPRQKISRLSWSCRCDLSAGSIDVIYKLK